MVRRGEVMGAESLLATHAVGAERTRASTHAAGSAENMWGTPPALAVSVAATRIVEGLRVVVHDRRVEVITEKEAGRLHLSCLRVS